MRQRGERMREQNQASGFDRDRFFWARLVRRDASLTMTARLVADVLAFDFANRETGLCTPSIGQIAQALGTSPDTVKRAVKALIEAGWMRREAGQGRGKNSGYAFISRAEVVPIKGGKYAPDAPEKGGKYAPIKGGKSAPLDGEKGANMHRKGGKYAPAHNIAKPYLNQRGESADPRHIDMAEFWAKKIEQGAFIPAGAISAAMAHLMIDLELIDPADLRRAGVDV